MRIRKLLANLSKQPGFTLVELLVAITITGLLVGGITTAVVQVLSVNSSSTNRMVAIKQVENAIDTLRRDVLVAQNLIPNTDGHILTLKWMTWEFNAVDTQTHIIIYDYDSVNEELTRTESVDGADTARVLARNIQSVTIDSYSEGRLRLTIEASSDGFRSATETRTFEILQRSAP